MSAANFLNTENINTLWDVVSDEEIFKFLSRDIQKKIAQLFFENVQNFFNKEIFNEEKSRQNTLIDLNKKYVLLILNYIKKTYPYEPNKIQILNETPEKEIITFEEIHNQRKSQFDKELQMIEKDFEESISIKAPPVPNFLDKYDDEPITEMDKIIREITIKRKYDIEQISNTNNNLNNNDWLKSQETSLKKDKLNKKQVKWEENDNTSINNIINYINIFNKIKKLKNIENEIENEKISHLENEKISNLENEIENEKISNLENEIISINKKIDKILNILNENKINR